MVLMYYAACTASSSEVLQDSFLFLFTRSRDSIVSIVTGLRAGWPRNRGSIPGWGKRFISILQLPDQLWGQRNFLFVGGGLLPDVKRPGREAAHSPFLMERLGMSGDVPVYACLSVSGTPYFVFCHPVLLVFFIKRDINWRTQLIDVVSLMWQYVSTPKGHLQASGIKYIKGTVYHCIQFLLCISYHWFEYEPLKSKHVATFKM